MVASETLRAIRTFFETFSEWRRFTALPPERRALTVYSEDVASWAFLGPVVDRLVDHHDQPVVYLTSAEDDPRRSDPRPGLQAFWIGEGMVRTLAFLQLETRLMVMTMPDLETYFLKRSRVSPVHYTHLFHSMVSSHMTYRPGAFDHFDSILCVGPHHEAEMRAQEERSGLAPRRLLRHGYARLDHLLATRPDPLPLRSDPVQVLVAPSWGPRGLLETRGVEVTRILLEAGYRVVVRPHPHTLKTAPDCVEAIRRAFPDAPLLTLETDVASTRSLFASSVMISDWSGAALDYAFGLERPVLFVDLPRKVNNPGYQELGVEPLEVRIREELGAVVPEQELPSLPDRVEELLQRTRAFPERLAELREETIFHVGRSAETGARALLELLQELEEPERERPA